MAYIAYPMAKAHPPYGDIYHGNIMRATALYGEHDRCTWVCASSTTNKESPMSQAHPTLQALKARASKSANFL